MLSSEEVERLRERRLLAYFKKFTKFKSARKPENCAHNQLVRLDNKSSVRLCSLSIRGDLTRDYDQCTLVKDAEECPKFQNKYSDEALQEQFKRIVDDTEFCYHHLPDIYSLNLVLESHPAIIEVPDIKGIREPTPPTKKKNRFWEYLKRVSNGV